MLWKNPNLVICSSSFYNWIWQRRETWKKKITKKLWKWGAELNEEIQKKKEQLFFRIISAVFIIVKTIYYELVKEKIEMKNHDSVCCFMFLFEFMWNFFFLPNFDDVFFIQIWLLKWEIWRGRCTLGNLIIFAIINFFALDLYDQEICRYSFTHSSPLLFKTQSNSHPPSFFFFFFLRIKTKKTRL